jgi:hypothetical protein
MAFPLPADVNLDSPQIKLLNECNQGFKEKNLDILKKCFHKDLRRIVHPRSMGLPEQTRDEWFEVVSGLFGFATELKVGYVHCYSNPLFPG